MEASHSFGIVTLAFGHKRYLRQAEALALSIKMHMPEMNIALISDVRSPHAIFDKLIPVDNSRGIGTIQKIWLDQYSPYNHSLFIDSDCLVTRPFHEELEEISKFDFTPIVTRFLGRGDKDDFYFEDLGKTLRIIDAEKFPKFNGGIYFFKKCPASAQIFAEARQIAKETRTLGLKSFDQGGAADETIIGLALAKLNIGPFYNDMGRMMRTPIGITGPLNIDVLGGGCSFLKEGELVTPAICHFAAPYSRYSPYAYNRFLVRYPASTRLTRSIAKHYFRLQRKIINKVNQQN